MNCVKELTQLKVEYNNINYVKEIQLNVREL